MTPISLKLLSGHLKLSLSLSFSPSSLIYYISVQFIFLPPPLSHQGNVSVKADNSITSQATIYCYLIEGGKASYHNNSHHIVIMESLKYSKSHFSQCFLGRMYIKHRYYFSQLLFRIFI